jgi:hypothetical protein
MEYPKNGSVVIIDDKIEEVEDLIVELSKRNVPTYYFRGNHSKLHRKLNNIKVIFLDINYEDSGAATPIAVIDNLVEIIKTLINKNAKDYIIITWSTTTESYHERLQTRLQSLYDLSDTLKLNPEKILYKMPKHIFSINKKDVKTGDIFDITKINEKINDVIPPQDIMNLAIHWENNVLDAAKKVLYNFDIMATTEEDQKKVYALFADSISQKKYLTKDNIIGPALSPISALLSDQLSMNKNTNELQEIGNELIDILSTDHKVDIDTVSKINTFYHIDKNISCNNAPGTIYNYNDFLKESCASKECSTMWAEGLEDKIKSKITSQINKTDYKENYVANYISLSESLLKFDKKKTFFWNIENIFGNEYDEKIEKKIMETYVEFNDDTEKTAHEGLKNYVRAVNKEIQKMIIEQQTEFVFKSKLDEKIKSFLSPKNNFDDLQFDIKMNLLKDYYVNNELDKIKEPFEKDSIPIFLEFSPDCDFVQGKRKKLRLVFGLLYPYDNYTEGQTVFNGDYYVYSPIIEYNHKPYRMVFDLHTVTGINENILVNKDVTEILFRLRKELLVDIQQKIATHIARPGFFNMNDYLE